MGTAKWWVCDSCTSLNDLPANKCYKCRVPKSADPTLIDDAYSQVGGGQRVGVTVDLSKVGDLTRPDPIETAEGGGIMEAFDSDADIYADIDGTPATPRYDPYASGPQPAAPPRPERRPLREPVKRGIDAIGGRHWTEEPAGPAEGAEEPTGAAPPATGATVPPPAPPAGAVPRPGVTEPPGTAPPPPVPPAPGAPPRPPAPSP